MSRRMTMVILAAFCALALSAVTSAGASGATAFTCNENIGINTNSDCQFGVGFGNWGLQGVTVPTEITTRQITRPIFIGKLFGATVEFTATGSECEGCTIENAEVGGVMEVKGPKASSTGGKIKFTGVTVVGAESKCTVVGSATGTITTKPLKFTTTSTAGATLEPETGTLLAEFAIKGAECTVAGTGIKVTGKVFGSLNGAVETINVTKASEELKLEGEKAALTMQKTIVGPSGRAVLLG